MRGYISEAVRNKEKKSESMVKMAVRSDYKEWIQEGTIEHKIHLMDGGRSF